MDTSNPSRPKDKRASAKADAREPSQAYWVAFSLREEADPLAENRGGGTWLTERGRMIEACWRSLGEGRPYLEPDSVSIGPRTVQGILRLKPGHPQALTLFAAARLFKLLSARALTGGENGSVNPSSPGMWKRGFTEKPLDTLKQVVDARAALDTRATPKSKTPSKARAKAKSKPKAKSRPKAKR